MIFYLFAPNRGLLYIIPFLWKAHQFDDELTAGKSMFIYLSLLNCNVHEVNVPQIN